MIYLDNAATTKPTKEALESAQNALENFGNPSSLHILGINAERIVENARVSVASILSVPAKQIVFTSGATESNNWVIQSISQKNHLGRQIITTQNEHPSILEPLKALEKQGFSVLYLPEITTNALENALKTPTCLVVTHHINSENGSVQDINLLTSRVKKHSPKTLVHIDCVQSFCKYPLDFSKIKADFASLSAHKIGCLKGAGALYIRQGVAIAPLICGGGQELNQRSGTQNTIGIASFLALPKNIQENFAYVQELKNKLISGFEFDFVQNSPNSSPYILNITIPSVRGEVLVNALSAKGVYISAGIACASNKNQRPQNIYSVRFSFSPENTLEEITQATTIVNNTVKNLTSFRGLK